MSSTGEFISVDWTDGTRINSLWQLHGGPTNDYLSWAWGKPNSTPPLTYDEAMITDGMKEFFFVSCPVGKSELICQFNPV